MLLTLLMILETDDDRNFLVSVYEDYACVLNIVARNKLYDSSLVDDCVQETFVELIKSFERFKKIPKEQQKSYILTICRRVAYNINSKNSGTISLEELNDTVALSNDFDFSAYDIFGVASTLNMLDEKYREPIVMKYRDELTTSEISQKLGISENLVSQRIYRGKKYLYEILAGVK